MFYNKEEMLFLSIVTVSKYKNYNSLDTVDKKLWDNKAKFYMRLGEYSMDEIYHLSAFYPEFGRIASISIAKYDDNELSIRSFTDYDEKIILNGFLRVFNHPKLKNNKVLTWNGYHYEYPFLAKRLLINGFKIPPDLNLFGLKDWKFPARLFSLSNFWQIGNNSKYPLNLIARMFNVEFVEQEQSQINLHYFKNFDSFDTSKEILNIEKYNIYKLNILFKIFDKLRL